ncbi:hypothetical protein SAMN05660297_02465 [Natronincola peptidivorans]|uniref:Uncharacterized protein n=1 Tax=Natronincola peptidivorans TaxID=426128 RepID=A0A1I0EN48_9FIRM|nr:hypothetical protein [Natronincola peptidivorans]SET45994.1 hypothetical protein SAMN05660297_02465 [Natronincola peptidivorans]
MKTKTPITKGIAVILCMITVALSWNIYISYKSSYFAEDTFEKSLAYIAMAEGQSMELTLAPVEKEIIYQETEVAEKNEALQQKKILIKFFLLLLSFVSLAALQNFVYSIESIKGYEAEKHKTISPLISKEGEK